MAGNAVGHAWADGWGRPSLTRRTFGKMAGVTAGAVGLVSTGGVLRSVRAAEPPITGMVLTDETPVPFGSVLGQVMTQAPELLDSFAVQYGEQVPESVQSEVDFLFRWLPFPLFDSAMQYLQPTEGPGGGKDKDKDKDKECKGGHAKGKDGGHEHSNGNGHCEDDVDPDPPDGGVLCDAEKELLKQHLWLMHLVGYFGGVWFGKKLDEFNPAAEASASTSDDPVDPDDDSGFAALAGYLQRAEDALCGTNSVGQDAVAFAEWALRGDEFAEDPTNALGIALSALITLYGYNVGYTENILIPPHRAQPVPYVRPDGTLTEPADAFRPPYNSMIATPTGVFDARYPDLSQDTPPPHPGDPAEFAPVPPDPRPWAPLPAFLGDAPGLVRARELWTAAAMSHPDGFNRVMNETASGTPDSLSARQAAGYNVGNATWNVPLFLDVKRWDKSSYEGIVALSIFFVEAVQVAGMACVAEAALRDDGADGIRGTKAAALVQPFGGSYSVGLSEGGRPPYRDKGADEALPKFTRS